MSKTFKVFAFLKQKHTNPVIGLHVYRGDEIAFFNLPLDAPYIDDRELTYQLCKKLREATRWFSQQDYGDAWRKHYSEDWDDIDSGNLHSVADLVVRECVSEHLNAAA